MQPHFIVVSLIGLIPNVVPFPHNGASKRDMASDVCGSPGTPIADVTRNADTWVANRCDQWFEAIIKSYANLNWTKPLGLGGPAPRNVQDIILTEAGKEGVGECKELLNPNCGPTGLDFNLCKAYPQAHFVWIAITNYANFLNKLHGAWLDCVASLTPLTGTLRSEFFTPETDLNKFIVPVSVVSGIAGAIAGFVGPVAIIAGAGTIINAVLTQAGLEQVDPTDQWSAVQSAIGSAFTQVTNALDELFKTTLTSLPEEKGLAPIYTEDPLQLPVLLKKGVFAADVPVGAFGQGLYGALAASGINALWSADGVFLIKISDKTYGKGDGAACEAFKVMTVCIGGVAYIWSRWAFTAALTTAADTFYAYLNEKTWNVRGAYKQGSGNDNKLGTYGLDLTVITKSAIKTFNDHGFPFTDQNGATIRQIKDHPTNLKLEDLMFFSIPICDLDAVGNGRHLKDPPPRQTGDPIQDNPIVRFTGCSCLMYDKWPKDLPLYKGPYGIADPTHCNREGWS